ncbi:hypothetical protein Kpho02_60360 [Kitasatospora phosalacinea]|uniref:Uncharacterized protein n=1 Tax=Kitasatospora phosalacinea TaxID=2065 RepID=A0A9W6QEY7_9ACTN|nr:hypothetical protein Kpho02_60360 [Kitasatospora phosalacinea]
MTRRETTLSPVCQRRGREPRVALRSGSMCSRQLSPGVRSPSAGEFGGAPGESRGDVAHGGVVGDAERAHEVERVAGGGGCVEELGPAEAVEGGFVGEDQLQGGLGNGLRAGS